MPRVDLQRRQFVRSAAVVAGSALLPDRPARTRNRQFIALSSLDIRLTRQGWEKPQRNRRSAVQPLTIGSRKFKSGVGVVADSVLRVRLDGAATAFTAWVGADVAGGPSACVRFYVITDGRIAARTKPMHGGKPPLRLRVDLTNVREMLLVVEAAGYRTWSNLADWAAARIWLQANAPFKPVSAPYFPDLSKPQIAVGDGPQPQFHGPSVVGTTPGRDFIFRIPVTGTPAARIHAVGLPAGIVLEGGVLRGSAQMAGIYKVQLIAENDCGKSGRSLTIVVGNRKLSQTPQMGWSSWNAFGANISQAKIKSAADALINSGLADKGYSFINIDDGWSGPRDAAGRITADKSKFPNIKELIGYIHSRGLKFGIYSSPGPTTCGGYTGSYGHEVSDLTTFCQWGVDFLKYDWCSYGSVVPPNPTLGELIEPYAVMGQAIGLAQRDIVFSLCQYGMGKSWQWAGGPEVHGNQWRISDDLIDFWGSVCSNGFNCDSRTAAAAGPGHWNDPDMLVVGMVDFTNAGLGFPGKPSPSRLTPIEQQTHVGLWALLAAPLIIGCDLTKLDPFTFNLLSNTEVIAVDQDKLGRQARRVMQFGDMQLWARPLCDGTMAVGVFNLSPVKASCAVEWAQVASLIGMPIRQGRSTVRDLWQRRNLSACGGMSLRLPSHGSILLKIG